MNKGSGKMYRSDMVRLIRAFADHGFDMPSGDVEKLKDAFRMAADELQKPREFSGWNKVGDLYPQIPPVELTPEIIHACRYLVTVQVERKKIMGKDYITLDVQEACWAGSAGWQTLNGEPLKNVIAWAQRPLPYCGE
jgi:glycerol kinase